jgi:hypothetical protein
MRPAAIGAGVVAAGLGALAVQQGVAAADAYARARSLVGAGGVLLPGVDPARYASLEARGNASRRTALLAATSAVVTATVSGVLAWWSRHPGPPR